MSTLLEIEERVKKRRKDGADDNVELPRWQMRSAELCGCGTPASRSPSGHDQLLEVRHTLCSCSSSHFVLNSSFRHSNAWPKVLKAVQVVSYGMLVTRGRWEDDGCDDGGGAAVRCSYARVPWGRMTMRRYAMVVAGDRRERRRHPCLQCKVSSQIRSCLLYRDGFLPELSLEGFTHLRRLTDQHRLSPSLD